MSSSESIAMIEGEADDFVIINTAPEGLSADSPVTNSQSINNQNSHSQTLNSSNNTNTSIDDSKNLDKNKENTDQTKKSNVWNHNPLTNNIISSNNPTIIPSSDPIKNIINEGHNLDQIKLDYVYATQLDQAFQAESEINKKLEINNNKKDKIAYTNIKYKKLIFDTKIKVKNPVNDKINDNNEDYDNDYNEDYDEYDNDGLGPVKIEKKQSIPIKLAPLTKQEEHYRNSILSRIADEESLSQESRKEEANRQHIIYQRRDAKAARITLTKSKVKKSDNSIHFDRKSKQTAF